MKRSYGEPHWEKKQGAAVAYERVTLYGVPIVPRRRVQFARIDPEYARELFIRHALVEGDWPTLAAADAFDRANRALRDELTELEERTRRRDILVDDEAVFEFYDARDPAPMIASTRGFEGWWRRERAARPRAADDDARRTCSTTTTAADADDERSAASRRVAAGRPATCALRTASSRAPTTTA